MSQPLKYCSSGSVSTEIISGCSALHMNPEPLENPSGTYLSDTDSWVKHSLEHFHTAVDYSNHVSSAFNRVLNVLEMTIYKIYRDEYDFDWYKMTDIERANVMAGILAKKLHS